MSFVGDPQGIDDFVALAERALAAIPQELGQHIDNVGFVVEEWADARTLRRMGIGQPLQLLGLYRGVPRIRRSVLDVARLPDRVFLYRQPILNYAARTGRMYSVVRHVLVHEIAHHFGFSDADIDALETGPDRVQVEH